MIEGLSSRLHSAVFGPDLSYDDGFPDVTDDAVFRERVSGGKTLAAFRVRVPPIGIPDEQPEYTTRFSRYLADGTLDRTFGRNGELNVGIVGQLEFVPGSRILVVPELSGIVRSYTLNGRVDTSFGGDGVVEMPTGKTGASNSVFGEAEIEQVLEDGSLLLRTQFSIVPGYPGEIRQQHDITRLKPDGTLDTTFGRRGFLSFQQDKGFVEDVIATPNALYIHINYGGLTNPASGDLIKITPDGKTAETYFGAQGRLKVPGFIESITEQPDGRIVFLQNTSNPNPVLYRINHDGSPDTSFSGDGKITLTDPKLISDAYNGSLLLDDQNRIVVSVGKTIFRVSPSGTLDSYPFNGTTSFPADALRVDAQDNVYASDGLRYGMVLPQQLDASGILQIATDSNDDTITLSDAGGGRIRVVVNSDSRLFRAREVRGFNIQTYNGDLDFRNTLALPVTLQGGEGDVTYVGGSGDEQIELGFGDHTVNLGGGNDTLTIGQITQTVVNDRHTVTGTGGNKIIRLRTGTATIDLPAGNHGISSEESTRNNQITIAGGNNIVDLGGTGDVLTIGGRGRNTVNAYRDDVTVTTGSGADTILAASGYGTINSGAGNDTIKVRNYRQNVTRGVTVYAGSGNDHVFCAENYDSLATVYGGPGDDLLEGGTLSQRLYGENGNDTLNGGDGNDYLFGGDLNDVIVGGASSDRLFGDAGDDKLYGQSGNDTLTGGTGNDSLLAQTGSDVLFGDAGNDRLYADNNLGRYLMHGGDGDDLFFTRNNSIDTLFGNAGNDLASADANDVLTDITRA